MNKLQKSIEVKDYKDEVKVSKKKSSQPSFLAHAFRVIEHILLCALAFAGVMSLIKADPVVSYTLAGVLVFILAKDTI